MREELQMYHKLYLQTVSDKTKVISSSKLLSMKKLYRLYNMHFWSTVLYSFINRQQWFSQLPSYYTQYNVCIKSSALKSVPYPNYYILINQAVLQCTNREPLCEQLILYATHRLFYVCMIYIFHLNCMTNACLVYDYLLNKMYSLLTQAETVSFYIDSVVNFYNIHIFEWDCHKVFTQYNWEKLMWQNQNFHNIQMFYSVCIYLLICWLRCIYFHDLQTIIVSKLTMFVVIIYILLVMIKQNVW